MPELRHLSTLVFSFALLLAARRHVALAQGQDEPVPFGRYDLVAGQTNLVCLAFGDQLKTYSKIPAGLMPHQSDWRKRWAFTDSYDFRCDFPLRTKGDITLPDWAAWNPISSDHESSLLSPAQEVFNGFFRADAPAASEASVLDIDEREKIIRTSRAPLLRQLIGWGIIRYQTAAFPIAGLGPVKLYRFSFPPSLQQNCWTIGFSANSSLYKLRFLSFPILQIFRFGGKTYYLSGRTPVPGSPSLHFDLRIASMEELADVELGPDSPDPVKNQSPETLGFDHVRVPPIHCGFQLRRGAGQGYPHPP